MCKHTSYDKDGNLICKPIGDKCLFCVFGNSKRYNEIEKSNEEKEKRNG